ncbi:MAG: Mov34/MPN/PAD-1 family protein [bacterium JZ-2024 1]
MRDIILAATEVYKRETLGYLLGVIGEDGVWTILNAAPYQTAEKTFTGTAVRQQKIDLIAKLTEYFGTNFRLLGDFHSHAQWGDRLRRAMPSDEDVADAQPGFLYVIIALNDLPKEQRKSQWRISRNRMILSGSVGKFHFEISAYFCLRLRKLVKVPLTLQGALDEPISGSPKRRGRRGAFE